MIIKGKGGGNISAGFKQIVNKATTYPFVAFCNNNPAIDFLPMF